MSAGPTDAVRLSARALGPLLMVLAGLLAWRAELGLAGAAAGGLLGGLVLALHPLTEGWREARRALPVNLTLLFLIFGLVLMAAAWIVPVAAPALSPQDARLEAALLAGQAAQVLAAVGAAIVSGAALTVAFALFVARAPDLRDEGW